MAIHAPPPVMPEARAIRQTRGMPVRDGRGSLSETVAGTIGRRIVSGQYRPGETLPTEPRIQEEFGVSRTAVREAIRLLSAKGLTVSRPKIGTRPIDDLRRLDVVELLDSIAAERSAIVADHVLSILRPAFNWHALRDDSFRSPIVSGMSWFKDNMNGSGNADCRTSACNNWILVRTRPAGSP